MTFWNKKHVILNEHFLIESGANNLFSYIFDSLTLKNILNAHFSKTIEQSQVHEQAKTSHKIRRLSMKWFECNPYVNVFKIGKHRKIEANLYVKLNHSANNFIFL